MVKLRVLKKEKLKFDYKLEVPKRFGDEVEMDIRIEFIEGEYQYKPRVHNFLGKPRLCVEELEAITNKLRILNKSLNNDKFKKGYKN